MTEVPGRAPPMLIIANRIARPIDALARWPGPRAPYPEATPHIARAGPLTMISGAVA